MSLDRNATLKNADKLLAEGKLDEALKEYVQLADHFYGEGFFPTASALYKKAIKLTPDHEHSLFRLYDIAVVQALTVDARTYMRQLVKLRNERSDIVGVAECLARLAKLPDGGAELRRTRELLGMTVSDPSVPPSPEPPAKTTEPDPQPEPVLEEIPLESIVTEQALEDPAIEPLQLPVASGHDEPVASEGPRTIETVFGEMRSRTAHDRRAMLYDLADALEQRGEHGRALEIFMQVQSDDDAYRDVAERIERLRVVQGSSPA